MKNLSYLLSSFVILAFICTSCATVFSGSKPKILVDGFIKEPVTITTEVETYNDVRLPCMVKVRRKGLDGQKITIQSKTKRYRDIILEKTFNEVSLINYYNFIGWIIDLSTNCISRPYQTHFYVDEEYAYPLNDEKEAEAPICPKCKAMVKPEQKFCSECGKDLK